MMNMGWIRWSVQCFPNSDQWGTEAYMFKGTLKGHLLIGGPPTGEGQGHGGLVICYHQRGVQALFPLT